MSLREMNKQTARIEALVRDVNLALAKANAAGAMLNEVVFGVSLPPEPGASGSPEQRDRRSKGGPVANFPDWLGVIAKRVQGNSPFTTKAVRAYFPDRKAGNVARLLRTFARHNPAVVQRFGYGKYRFVSRGVTAV